MVKGEGLVLRETKNKKSRVIPISQTTLDILKTHKSYQEMQKDGWDENSGLIFPNTVGKPLDAKRDYKWWLDILERADVKHYQLYQMRKTAISNLGTPNSTILKFTGHSSMSVAPQRFIGIDISNPAHNLLIQDYRFDGSLTTLHRCNHRIAIKGGIKGIHRNMQRRCWNSPNHLFYR